MFEALVLNSSDRNAFDRFYLTLCRPFWCLKTMNRRNAGVIDTL